MIGCLGCFGLVPSQKKDELHFRTYKPVFDAYLDRGDVTSAFKLFVKMRQGASVQLQPETYVQLIACVAENGYFRYVTLQTAWVP
jgi:pentatricopeptide repeat protein